MPQPFQLVITAETFAGLAGAMRAAAEAIELVGLEPEEILKRVPAAKDLDCSKIVAAGRRGHRGVAAVRVALRTRARGMRAPVRPVRTQSRSREARPRSRGKARSCSPDHLPGDDDDPDPPGCVVCGRALTASRRHAQTCSGACRTRLYRQRRQADSLELLNDAAIKLIERGELGPWEALAEVVFPSPQLRRKLEVAA